MILIRNSLYSECIIGCCAVYIEYERMELIVNGKNSDTDMDSNSKTRFAYATGVCTSYKISEN